MFKSIGLLMVLALIGCQTEPLGSTSVSESVAANTPRDLTSKPLAEESRDQTGGPLWTSELDQSDWIDNWEPRDSKSWGDDNLEILSPADGPFETVLRVY
ncbi:MAG: hypothetical protein AAF808_23470, partial [Cyanobacteria bacterium P01_D01_bin.2]